MFGSLYYNAWIALFAFTVYFLAKFQTDQLPLSIILYGLLWAVIAFILTFILRALIGYIVFTPEKEDSVNEHLNDENIEENPIQLAGKDTSVETNSEEVAKVVQTMLQKDEN